MTLKDIRKELREYVNRTGNPYGRYGIPISFTPKTGFYYILVENKHAYQNMKWITNDFQSDEYTVFHMYKDGSLKVVNDTEHAKQFHKARKEIAKRRR